MSDVRGHRTEPRRCVCGGPGLIEFDGETVTTWCPTCGRTVLPKSFPMLYAGRREEQLRAQLPSVPWAFLAPHEWQAFRNHDQRLARLAERGGLSPAETLCAIQGLGLKFLFRRMTEEERFADEAKAVCEILALVEAWKARAP